MEGEYLEKDGIGYDFSQIVIRFLVLLVGTLLFSVIYGGIIELGFFNHVKAAARRYVFCAVELFVLLLYWYCLCMLSRISYDSSPSLTKYYIWTVFSFAAFCAVYWAAHVFLSRGDFLWLFRVTVNLIFVRLQTKVPDSLRYYIIPYLIITFLIMLLEPPVERLRYEIWRRRMDRRNNY